MQPITASSSAVNTQLSGVNIRHGTNGSLQLQVLAARTWIHVDVSSWRRGTGEVAPTKQRWSFKAATTMALCRNRNAVCLQLGPDRHRHVRKKYQYREPHSRFQVRSWADRQSASVRLAAPSELRRLTLQTPASLYQWCWCQPKRKVDGVSSFSLVERRAVKLLPPIKPPLLQMSWRIWVSSICNISLENGRFRCRLISKRSDRVIEPMQESFKPFIWYSFEPGNLPAIDLSFSCCLGKLC